jgi:hypothetical protein
MELIALAALGGAGYFLAQKTTPTYASPTKSAQGAPKARQAIQKQSQGIPKTPIAQVRGGNVEAFANAANVSAPQTSLRGTNPQLDLKYNDLMGRKPMASQPNASAQTGYVPSGTLSLEPPVMKPVADWMPTPTNNLYGTPDIQMNPAGIEENPNYMDGSSFKSALSGQSMSSTDFTHNNMQPFFGGRVKQNVNTESYTNVLGKYTGDDRTTIRKQEVEQMFDNTQTPFGNVYGMEASSDFIQSRINDPRNRGGERPFEPVQVAPGVGEGFSSTGKGGFQQIEVNDLMMKNMRRTDDLRTSDNPKLSYNMPVISGQHMIGKAMDSAGEVRKYRPDAFSVNEGADRFGPAGQGEHTKETSRPVQIMPETARAETSVEYMGPSASQDFGMNYVTGSYKKPTAQQYGGAGYRNADGSTYFVQGAEDDYGKESYEIRPNERYFTSDRVMGLNVSPAEAGATTIHYEDESRPTRRAETVGNIQQAGVPTGYAGGAPAITVWDPNDIARTTVKEGTIQNDRFGIAAPADGPSKLKVYDPDDIARPTQKAQISAKSAYTGNAKAAHERFTSHTSAYNMRLNPSKQQIAKGRTLAGGNIQVFKGDEPNVTSKKLDIDVINDRAPAINRGLDLGPGVADLGRVKYRAPLKLDVANERNQREMISQAENNPLMISLQKSAEHDAKLADQVKMLMAGGR